MTPTSNPSRSGPHYVREPSTLEQEVRERFNAPALNVARYIADDTVTDVDNGE
ncbi:hypothetical protein [Streptomyces coeruleorubidus]|uniref:hypothetical protein n=1 Tax=Streptomyces coeruleorubidus TaxID=116188 RepID=UPI0037B2F421